MADFAGAGEHDLAAVEEVRIRACSPNCGCEDCLSSTITDVPRTDRPTPNVTTQRRRRKPAFSAVPGSRLLFESFPPRRRIPSQIHYRRNENTVALYGINDAKRKSAHEAPAVIRGYSPPSVGMSEYPPDSCFHFVQKICPQSCALLIIVGQCVGQFIFRRREKPVSHRL